MDETTATQVKSLIDKAVTDPEIYSLVLSWFGGEPLLEYPLVRQLTDYARKIAEENEKSFSCDITTNGTLLNAERIEALRKAGVTSYQITIDGDKAVHDSVKVLKNRSAYEATLANIDKIAAHTHCNLRYNYTHENLSPQTIVSDLKPRISKENLKNVHFMMFKVWQESTEAIDTNKVSDLVAMSTEMGIPPALQTCDMCYADQKNFVCVYPNGNIRKCDNESPDSIGGRLEDGAPVWNDDADLHIPAFKNDKFPCHKCRYVPVCWGPCVANRRKILEQNNGKGACQFYDRDNEIRQSILNRCVNIKRYELNK